MKRLILAILAICMVGSICDAAPSEKATSTGSLGASAVIVARPARLTDMAVYTDGTNTVTVTCYDNATTGSGTIIGKAIVPGAALAGGLFIQIPVQAASGIYCTLSGTGGSMIISYDPQ